VLLTRSPLGLHRCCHRMDLARLACVRHAASVRPEPGSNSPSKSRPAEAGFDMESQRRGAAPRLTGTSRNGMFIEIASDDHARTTRVRMIARTGFFVLYSVFKEHRGRGGADTGTRRSRCGHRSAGAAANPAAPVLPSRGGASEERSANLPGTPERVKPFCRAPCRAGGRLNLARPVRAANLRSQDSGSSIGTLRRFHLRRPKVFNRRASPPIPRAAPLLRARRPPGSAASCPGGASRSARAGDRHPAGHGFR
jgi:hypothetical protein